MYNLLEHASALTRTVDFKCEHFILQLTQHFHLALVTTAPSQPESVTSHRDRGTGRALPGRSAACQCQWLPAGPTRTVLGSSSDRACTPYSRSALPQLRTQPVPQCQCQWPGHGPLAQLRKFPVTQAGPGRGSLRAGPPAAGTGTEPSRRGEALSHWQVASDSAKP
jgi:hypothetical protein